MNFGKNIVEARERLGWTREELAARIGVKYHTLSKYETSEREPDFETLLKISDALRVSVDALLGCTTQHEKRQRKKKPDAADAAGLWALFLDLPQDARARIENQIFFEARQHKQKKSN